MKKIRVLRDFVIELSSLRALRALRSIIAQDERRRVGPGLFANRRPEVQEILSFEEQTFDLLIFCKL
jgi:hypothetical protein